jgi:hypothetical protein
MPDDADTQAMCKCLADFHAFAATHDPDLTARRIATHEVSDTLDAIAVVRAWLQRYADALQRRR